MPVYNSQYTGTDHDTYVTKQQLINLIYPVGSIYTSVNSTSPATLFGGTWEQIQNRFLLACGSNYSSGTTGGVTTHSHTYAHTHTTPVTNTGSTTLSISQIPAHNHTITVYNDDFSNGGDGTTNINTKKTWPGFTYDVAAGSGGWNYSKINNTGGSGGHTHSQVATTTDSQSVSATSAENSLPPYLAVYVWKRTA